MGLMKWLFRRPIGRRNDGKSKVSVPNLDGVENSIRSVDASSDKNADLGFDQMSFL